jgi:hypothetical protein
MDLSILKFPKLNELKELVERESYEKTQKHENQ